MLIWGLQFREGEIMQSPKFSGSRCAVCGLKVEEGELISVLIFLACHCSSHFLSIKSFFRNWRANYLGPLKMSV